MPPRNQVEASYWSCKRNQQRDRNLEGRRVVDNLGGKSPNFVPLPSVIDAQIVICLKQVTIKVFLTHSEKEL